MGRGGVGIERLEEVDEYGALDGGEVSVPNEIEGDVALKEWPVVVLENERLLLNKREEFSRCGGGEVGKAGE